MDISVSAQGFDLTPAMDHAVRTRLAAALGRFSGVLLSVDVFLRDVNGPKGGCDKQVLTKIRLSNRQVLAIESTCSSLYAAIATGARRARRSVRRAVGKQQRLEKRLLRDLRTLSEPGTL